MAPSGPLGPGTPGSPGIRGQASRSAGGPGSPEIGITTGVTDSSAHEQALSATSRRASNTTLTCRREC